MANAPRDAKTKAGARQAEPPPKSHKKIDDDRDCLKASGNIDLDVKPDGELLSHLNSLRVDSAP